MPLQPSKHSSRRAIPYDECRIRRAGKRRPSICGERTSVNGILVLSQAAARCAGGDIPNDQAVIFARARQRGSPIRRERAAAHPLRATRQPLNLQRRTLMGCGQQAPVRRPRERRPLRGLATARCRQTTDGRRLQRPRMTARLLAMLRPIGGSAAAGSLEVDALLRALVGWDCRAGAHGRR
jgi:hypothetical protein